MENETMVYVVMVKKPGNIIMTDKVFASYDLAKRYVRRKNKDTSDFGYYYTEKCFMRGDSND